MQHDWTAQWQVADLLENPIIAIDSKNNADARIVMGDLYDQNGKIVTAVWLLTPTSKKGNVLDMIKVSSAEGRSHIKSRFVYEDGSPVNVRYFDKKRIRSWLNVNRLQLPLHNLDSDSIINIPNEPTDVKQKFLLSDGVEADVMMDRQPVNAIRSTYGLENSQNWIKNQIDQGKTFTVYNEKEANSFLQTYGYSASVGEGIRLLDESIHSERPIVKQKFSLSEDAVSKKYVAGELRAILNRGGDAAELRRYARVAQLRREGKLPTPSDDISPEISAKVLESLKETFGKKESQ